MTKPKFTPRRAYNFRTMKRGGTKTIPVPSSDPVAGTRALTAAYAFARRHNETAKKADRVKFAGRLSKNKRTMTIHRVQ